MSGVATWLTLLESDKDLIESSLAETGDETPLLALNGAFQEDGYALILERTTLVDELVEVLHVNAAPQLINPEISLPLAPEQGFDCLKLTWELTLQLSFLTGLHTQLLLMRGKGGASSPSNAACQHSSYKHHPNPARRSGASYNSFVLAEG